MPTTSEVALLFQCDICHKEVGNNEHGIQCEGCDRWQHVECNGLTRGEYDIIKRKNCKLSWLCVECKPRVLRRCNTKDEESIKILTEKVQELLNFMENKLQEKIRDEIASMLPTELDKHKVGPVAIQQVKQKAPKPPISDVHSQKQSKKRPTNSMTPELASDTRIQDPHTTRCLEEKEEENETHMENDQESQWVTQTYRRRKTVVIGTKADGDPRVKAGESTAWLYVGKLHNTTTTVGLKSYLEENGITGEIKCEELISRGNNKAFKIGVAFENLEGINSPGLWPKRVVVRRFRFIRERQGEVLLRGERVD